MRFQPRDRDLPLVNLTPLIDILFIVLMFLVLTATFQRTATIDLALPNTEAATPLDGPATEAIRIVVRSDGRVVLGERSVSLAELQQALGAVPDPDRQRVLLAADMRSSHGDVVAVLDVVRRVGFQALELETTQSTAPITER